MDNAKARSLESLTLTSADCRLEQRQGRGRGQRVCHLEDARVAATIAPATLRLDVVGR